MPCLNFGNAIICVSAGFYRLRTTDNRYIFMEWHNYLGPLFFKDRAAMREIDNWWEDPLICDALDWFTGRGERA